MLEGEEAAVYRKKQQKKANSEFKAWKDELCKIVRMQSRLIFNPDGTWNFILPSKLVKLVWSTTIQERIKVELAGGLDVDQARESALAKLRAEMDLAYKDFSTPPEVVEEDKEKEEQEEAKAKADIEKLRAEMIRGKL